MADEILAMCQDIPNSYRFMALVNLNYYWFDMSKAPQEYLDKATEMLQKTLAMNENDPDALGNFAILYLQKREYDKALDAAERSLMLDPGSAWAMWRYARVLSFSGRPEEAIPLLEKAIRLNPLGPSTFFADLGLSHRLLGRFKEAVAAYKKAIEKSPNDFWYHAHLVVVYAAMGRDEEAREEAAEVMRINPKFSVEWFAKTSMLKDRSTVEKAAEALRKAGLPDKAPASAQL
jgi:adenylate cyclase